MFDDGFWAFLELALKVVVALAAVGLLALIYGVWRWLT